jgi:hypothetical protein
MPGIDLSAMKGPDLRRLLKVAHSRHEGLLADRLEWEIAARRATGGVRPARPFGTPAEDDRDEPRITASDAQSFAPAYDAREPASGGRSVLLVTLGAVAGALISATVFWGLGRMAGPPSPGRAQSQPMMAMAVGPAAPAAAALPAPEPLPPQPEPVAPQALPVAATQAAEKETGLKMQVVRAAIPKAAAAKAERPPRPPTLAEWLAKPEPTSPIEPDEPLH